MLNIISEANAAAGGMLGGEGLLQFLPFVLILGIMYIFIFRPQSKRAKEHREMVSSIKRGDQVVVANSIIGKVAKVVDDHEIMVEIASGVEVKVIKSSVSQVVNKNIVADTSNSDSTGAKKKSATAAAKKAAPKKKTATKTVKK